jgi:serine/threonine protein kinase
MFLMVQNINPLENCEKEIQDMFYLKKNRHLLDFLQKCWRPQCSMRPSAKELLEHPFLKQQKPKKPKKRNSKKFNTFDTERLYKKASECQKCKKRRHSQCKKTIN